MKQGDDYLTPPFSAFSFQLSSYSRLLRNDFAVLPDVDGSSVSPRRLASCFSGATQRAADGYRKRFRIFRSIASLHRLRSNSRGLTPELSYTVHSSAKR